MTDMTGVRSMPDTDETAALLRQAAGQCDKMPGDTGKYLRMLLVLESRTVEPASAHTQIAAKLAAAVLALAGERRISAAVDALLLIDTHGCTNYTRGRCWESGRRRGAACAAVAWCDACVASAALAPTGPPAEPCGDPHPDNGLTCQLAANHDVHRHVGAGGAHAWQLQRDSPADPESRLCSCSSTTVVRIHDPGTYCGDAMRERLADAVRALWPDWGLDVEAIAGAALDGLAASTTTGGEPHA